MIEIQLASKRVAPLEPYMDLAIRAGETFFLAAEPLLAWVASVELYTFGDSESIEGMPSESASRVSVGWLLLLLLCPNGARANRLRWSSVGAIGCSES